MILSDLPVQGRSLLSHWIDWPAFRRSSYVSLPSFLKNASDRVVRQWFLRIGYKTVSFSDIPFLWEPQWFNECFHLPPGTPDKLICEYIIQHELEPEKYLAYRRDASLSAQDASLSAQDASLSAQDASLSAQDASLSAQDASLSAQDASLSAQDASLSAQDASFAQSRPMIDTAVFLDKIEAHLPTKHVMPLPDTPTRSLTDEILEILQQIYDNDHP